MVLQLYSCMDGFIGVWHPLPECTRYVLFLFICCPILALHLYPPTSSVYSHTMRYSNTALRLLYAMIRDEQIKHAYCVQTFIIQVMLMFFVVYSSLITRCEWSVEMVQYTQVPAHWIYLQEPYCAKYLNHMSSSSVWYGTSTPNEFW